MQRMFSNKKLKPPGSYFKHCLWGTFSGRCSHHASVFLCHQRQLPPPRACKLSQSLSRVRLSAARQAPVSMAFSRQEHWSGLPCPPPGDLPDLVVEPASPVSPALAGGFFNSEPPGKLPPHVFPAIYAGGAASWSHPLSHGKVTSTCGRLKERWWFKKKKGDGFILHTNI